MRRIPSLRAGEAAPTRLAGPHLLGRSAAPRRGADTRGEEGPLAGKNLERVENHLSQWYGWAVFFPTTSIYGRTDPPQPGNPFDTERPH